MCSLLSGKKRRVAIEALITRRRLRENLKTPVAVMDTVSDCLIRLNEYLVTLKSGVSGGVFQFDCLKLLIYLSIFYTI